MMTRRSFTSISTVTIRCFIFRAHQLAVNIEFNLNNANIITSGCRNHGITFGAYLAAIRRRGNNDCRRDVDSDAIGGVGVDRWIETDRLAELKVIVIRSCAASDSGNTQRLGAGGRSLDRFNSVGVVRSGEASALLSVNKTAAI